MKNDTTNEIKTPEEKTTETPKMTEEEMKKFISVISNTQEIEGDYLFNGFLFFFQTISETVRENPVEAQNLIFQLQQHVFNNLMWESFWAFDAHRKKAHLIFSTAEPHIYHDEEAEAEKDEKEIAESLPLDLSELPESCQHLNTLANQLSSVLRNPNLPADIYNAIMEAKDKISDFNNSQILTDYETSPEHLEAIWKVVCGSAKDGGDVE
jgi:cAMP phosphodiesterase